MSFIAGTKILTDTGWKNIETIAGRDKVLVRNFAGDAEFIQPFALRKRDYNGEVVKLSGRWWSFSVTPDHDVVYLKKGTEKVEPAEEYKIDQHKYLWRKFRYNTPQNYLQEYFISDRGMGTSNSINDNDWYTLVGYVVRRGEISKRGKQWALFIHPNPNRLGEEMEEIGRLLDRIGVEWSVVKNGKRTSVFVSTKNNLATKLKYHLGTRKRADMFLPDKMVFNSSKDNARTLIETIIRSSSTSINDKSVYQWSSSNKKLIDTLEIMGAFAGYTISHRLARPKGYKLPKGVTKRASYNVYIRDSMNKTSPTSKNVVKYSGSVYQVDIFSGQVFIKYDNGLPIWMNPE